jgi:hypothetical protein
MGFIYLYEIEPCNCKWGRKVLRKVEEERWCR